MTNEDDIPLQQSDLWPVPEPVAGLTWESHYVAMAGRGSTANDMTGWWITGYDGDGFPRATLHLDEGARDASGEVVDDELAARVIGFLRDPRALAA